jgi:hypothetical protein
MQCVSKMLGQIQDWVFYIKEAEIFIYKFVRKHLVVEV